MVAVLATMAAEFGRGVGTGETVGTVVGCDAIS